MRITVINLGNNKGLLLPKNICDLQKINFGDEFEFDFDNKNCILLRHIRRDN